MPLHAIRGGNAGGDEYRVLNMPRCRVWNATGSTNASAGGIAWTDVDYDTDSMTSIPTQDITCNSPGVYIVQAHVEYTTGVGARFTGIGDLAITKWVASTRTANSSASSAVATIHDITGLWSANKGDIVFVYISTSTDNTDIAGGQYSLFLSACMISTLG